MMPSRVRCAPRARGRGWKAHAALEQQPPPPPPPAADGDPDIDTLPYLAWSRSILQRAAPAGLDRFLLRHQAFVYFPLLLFARLTWCWQSLAYVFGAPAPGSPMSARRDAARPLAYPLLERACLVAHWLLLGALLATAFDSAAAAARFFLLAQGSAGLLLAFAFGVGHNGMEVFDAAARPAFSELQVRTTRDVIDTPFNAWFMGGLHYQIEHHLFPTLPRHSLAAIAPRVRALCARHGVAYRCTGLLEGTGEVLSHLADVAGELQNGPQ